MFARPHSQADDGSLAAALSPFVISQPGDEEDKDDDGDENDNIALVNIQLLCIHSKEDDLVIMIWHIRARVNTSSTQKVRKKLFKRCLSLYSSN